MRLEMRKIVHIVRQVPYIGNKNIGTGYLQFGVRKYGAKNQKIYYVHRFVWECYNGVIPDGKVIDHINDSRVDNRLCNLQLVTQQENCKKSAKNRFYSFVINNRRNRRRVVGIDVDAQKQISFRSM